MLLQIKNQKKIIKIYKSEHGDIIFRLLFGSIFF